MRHTQAPDDGFIQNMLKTYQAQGYTYLRDGGDRWGAGFRARELAKNYRITYKTPGTPLCKAGHYGSFIGACYSTINEYTQLVKKAKRDGADFIKIMISGLMDFNQFGVLTEPALDAKWIGQLVHIAHEEGFSVMAHANGTEAVLPAAEAGVDSIEHGAYLHEEALWAMKEAKTVWIPTVSTVGNLRGKGRFDDRAVEQILESALENIHRFTKMDGLIAPGSDAGAWSVPHGCDTEEALLCGAGVSPEALQANSG